jgi:hypothetical protein
VLAHRFKARTVAFVERIAPAAPSPNSAVATILLFDVSLLRKVSAHSSTTRYITLLPGRASAIAAAREMPTTPPAQPRPKIGRRWMSRRILSRSTTSASRLGVATPVVDATTMVSMSSTFSLASARSLRATSSRRFTAFSTKSSVRSTQPCGSLYQSIGTQEYRLSIPVFTNTGMKRSISRTFWNSCPARSAAALWSMG